MGHRIDKQRRQRAEIIANTIALSREVGPEAVRVRDVVARSNVSDATFFNYFAGKDAVLREWLEDLVDETLRAAAIGGAAPGEQRREQSSEQSSEQTPEQTAEQTAEQRRGLRRALRALADDLAAHAAEDTRTFGYALDAARFVALDDESDTLARGRPRRANSALELVEDARARGEIRADVPAYEVAGMLRAVVLAALANGLRGSPLPARELAARVRAAADVLLDGLRKRNERVRAPGRAARAPAPATGPAGS